MKLKGTLPAKLSYEMYNLNHHLEFEDLVYLIAVVVVVVVVTLTISTKRFIAQDNEMHLLSVGQIR